MLTGEHKPPAPHRFDGMSVQELLEDKRVQAGLVRLLKRSEVLKLEEKVNNNKYVDYLLQHPPKGCIAEYKPKQKVRKDGKPHSKKTKK